MKMKSQKCEINVANQGLKKCMLMFVSTAYTKALQHTQKNRHANFEIPLIFNILERYFMEIFYYFFTETSFVVHL